MRPTRYFIPLFFFFFYSNYLRVILAAFRTPVAHLLTTRLTINVFFFSSTRLSNIITIYGVCIALMIRHNNAKSSQTERSNDNHTTRRYKRWKFYFIYYYYHDIRRRKKPMCTGEKIHDGRNET